MCVYERERERERESVVFASGRCDVRIKDRADEFEQDPGDGEGQGSPACCCLWGRKELDMS